MKHQLLITILLFLYSHIQLNGFINTFILNKKICLRSSLSDDVNNLEIRLSDLNEQTQGLEKLYSERSKRFYDPKLTGMVKEKCILVSVDAKSQSLKQREIDANKLTSFSFKESLDELSELVGTAGLQVCACIIQNLYNPNTNSYIGMYLLF